MSKAVDLILAKPGMDRMKSRSIFVYRGVIRKLLLCKHMPFISLLWLMFSSHTAEHWIAPLQGTIEPLLEGYRVGLRTGDVESAGIARE